MIEVRVQQEEFDPAIELARLEALGGGAVASFTGLVRGDDGLLAMTLEHYPAMTESALRAIAEEAARRWPLAGTILIHRHGRLVPGERIVFLPYTEDVYAKTQVWIHERGIFEGEPMAADYAGSVAA